MNVEIAVFLLIFLSISSLATIGICFVEFRQDIDALLDRHRGFDG